MSEHLRNAGLAHAYAGRRVLVIGGTGRPEGLDKGYYVKPTVFANVTNDMTIAREEVFGPVLAVMRAFPENEGRSLAQPPPATAGRVG